MTNIFRCAVVTCVLLSPPLVTTALAQGYPTKPIRFILGPGPDSLARIFGQKFTDSWGQQSVIDQRPGAGGNIAAEMVAKATADGYTLLFATATFTINAVLQPGSFDLVRDFLPIALCATTPFILVVHPSVPARSIQDLIAVAKSRPGQINYASSGNGTGPHLTGEMFKSMAQVNIVHVPYKGAAPAIVDVMGGQVHMMFAIVASALGPMQTGKIRGLAVTSLQRSRLAPDLPTMDETGLPGFEANGWIGLLAPARTPNAIIAKLNGEVLGILKQPAVLQRLVDIGWDPASENSPEWFADYIRREIAKFAKLVKETGTTIN